MMFRIALFLAITTIQFAFSQTKIALIPQPKEIQLNEGFFVLNKETKILVPITLPANEIDLFNQFLTENYQFQLPVVSNSKSPNNTIQIQIDNSDLKDSGAYQLAVSKNTIQIKAQNALGVFYAFQTLQQLFPNDSSTEINIPCLEINDEPKFKWRGMHLDVCRHFFGVDFVKKYIDYLARYKMNTFHWHLTDDQGWRIEIKKYPKLTEVGAWRKGSMVEHYRNQKFDTIPHGGFYTQEQIKEVVAYAKARHITIVPEIEMPGHAVAALSAYSELACTKGPFEVEKMWGVFDDVFCPKEGTFKFLENVLTEVMDLFPSDYIHIGGDESPKTRWKVCPDCQKRIIDENLKDEHELQSYFIQRIEKFVNAKGRKIIGWDEILEGGLAPNAAVMSWRGTEGGIAAAKQKHFVVMTPGSHCYFDHYQAEPKNEPVAIGGYTTVEKVYSFNPIPEALNEEEAQYVLGAQGNVWTEYITTPEHVEYMMMTRMTALSEVLWGTSKPAQYKKFEERLLQHFKYFDKKGIHYSEAIFDIQSKVEIKNDKVELQLEARDEKGIRYTTDGSEPKISSEQYAKPISVVSSQTIKANYFENGTVKGRGFEQTFTISKSSAKPIVLESLPSENFSKGNPNVLVDGINGNTNEFGKDWLGFSGKDAVATINLNTKEVISTVQLQVFEGITSWIYFPTQITVETSTDGKNFKLQKTISKNEIAKGVINIQFNKTKAQFVKVSAKNFGIIPDGNPGAGNGAWLFIDEIAIF